MPALQTQYAALPAGQGDMAYGALLGAGSFVNMFVVGSILQSKPASSVQANPALIRDISSYLVMLGLLLPAFLSGLTLTNALAMVGFYALLLGAPGSLPSWASVQLAAVQCKIDCVPCGRMCLHLLWLHCQGWCPVPSLELSLSLV
jgi:Sodium/calcium exchanger protein